MRRKVRTWQRLAECPCDEACERGLAKNVRLRDLDLFMA